MTRAIIAVTGMAGAGKTLVADEIARIIDCPVVRLGDVVRHEARVCGVEPTDENLGEIMLQIRAKFGPTVVADRCLARFMDPADPVVVVDGIRSVHEVEAFRKSAEDVVLVAVHASPRTRLARLYDRERVDDPKTRRDFRARDERELDVGLGGAIAMADYVVVNEGKPKETKRAIAEVVRKIKSSLV